MDARGFYRALHRAFGETLRQVEASRRIDAVLARAFDSFEGNVAIQCEGEPPPNRSRSCAACCSLRVTATAPEVLLVAHFLRTVDAKLKAHGIDLRP